jgi:hypothetical protein
VLKRDPPKRFGRRETSAPPVMPYGAQDSVGRPRRESGESEPETHEVQSTRKYVWVADIGRTHRASFSPAGRKAWWCRRALAGKKSVAPPDAGRGWTEGETVRVLRTPNKSPVHGLRVNRLQVLDTVEGVLGLMPVLLSPARRSRVL